MLVLAIPANAEDYNPQVGQFYVVGNFTGWGVDEAYRMTSNKEAETEEYMYSLNLTTRSQFKVVYVDPETGEQTWLPDGMGNNYGENGEITDDDYYTIYFRPNADGGDDWFYNCIYVASTDPEPTEEPEPTEAPATEAPVTDPQPRRPQPKRPLPRLSPRRMSSATSPTGRSTKRIRWLRMTRSQNTSSA